MLPGVGMLLLLFLSLKELFGCVRRLPSSFLFLSLWSGWAHFDSSEVVHATVIASCFRCRKTHFYTMYNTLLLCSCLTSACAAKLPFWKSCAAAGGCFSLFLFCFLSCFSLLFVDAGFCRLGSCSSFNGLRRRCNIVATVWV